VHLPLDVRLQESGHLGVEPVLVHALVDHVYPAPGRPVHQEPLAGYAQISGLGKDGVHLSGVDVVVQVELVGGTAADDGERRAATFRGGGSQRIAEAPEPAV
jgi:hypothetical protein